MTQTQYENYFVNEQGDVFSTKWGGIKRLKPYNRKDGYLDIQIRNNFKAKNIKVHRLVAETFIPNPTNKPEVNHKNCIKWDNRVENLEWATKSENMSHAKYNGLMNPCIGENHSSSKLNEMQVIQIRELYTQKKHNKITHRKLAKMFNVSKQLITAIINKKTWKHI